MSLQTAGDIPIQITSENAGSERRITPSWSIRQLKSKLELVTGIPPLSQTLTLNRPGRPPVPIEAADEENTPLAHFPLERYAEIHVSLDCIFSFPSIHLSISRYAVSLAVVLNVP
jgi:tubulin-folding cofactor B